MLTLTSFSAAALAAPERLGAWTAFLAAARCKVVADSTPESFAADLNTIVSPWGFALAGLAISPQRLVVDTRGMSNGIWLLQVVEGRGTLRTERGAIDFAAGDLLYGKMPRELTLTALSRVCLNAAYFPRSGAGSRLASVPTTLVASPLTHTHGATEFLGDLLQNAVRKIVRISAEEIRPLESAITEFLFTAIATASAARSVLDGSTGKNAIVLRATQLLEAQLSDPDLSPTVAAEQLGISVRYLQKLFEAAGENVNHYIRRRRLERSREELMDPLYFQQSISEISFRWGFNDSAYFSRAFKELFGLSPSQHRETWRWHAAKCGKLPADKRPSRIVGLSARSL